jgi:GAG-pre-integrase domain
MTGNKIFLTNFRKYDTKQYMTVANNEKMEIIGDGSIKILSKIFVKNYASNLLSIRKLTIELNCKLIFSSKNMIFQELILKNVIGKRFFKNGLYYLDQEKFNLTIKREDQLSTIWHQRIGHPLDKILKYLFNFQDLDNSSCEIYKLAKFTRLPFNLSTCKSEKNI